MAGKIFQIPQDFPYQPAAILQQVQDERKWVAGGICGGIRAVPFWIPAYAGMTVEGRGDDGKGDCGKDGCYRPLP